MWADLACAVGIYVVAMSVVAAAAFYLHWDRRR